MRTSHRIPTYKLHRPSGQARVIIDGRHIYLGKFGSDKSRERYARLISELAILPADLLRAVRQDIWDFPREFSPLGRLLASIPLSLNPTCFR